MRILTTIRRTINRLFGINIKHSLKRKRSGRRRHVHVNSINRLMLGMVNNERRRRHLPPVVFDQGLYRHSVRWSKIMADTGRLFHSNTILENCCMVPSNGSPATITRRMFYTWKKSRPHWTWMMDPSVNKAAFAYAPRGKYSYGAYSFDPGHFKQEW